MHVSLRHVNKKGSGVSKHPVQKEQSKLKSSFAPDDGNSYNKINDSNSFYNDSDIIEAQSTPNLHEEADDEFI